MRALNTAAQHARRLRSLVRCVAALRMCVPSRRAFAAMLAGALRTSSRRHKVHVIGLAFCTFRNHFNSVEFAVLITFAIVSPRYFFGTFYFADVAQPWVGRF